MNAGVLAETPAGEKIVLKQPPFISLTKKEYVYKNVVIKV
jgi:hypothetical protein